MPSSVALHVPGVHGVDEECGGDCHFVEESRQECRRDNS